MIKAGKDRNGNRLETRKDRLISKSFQIHLFTQHCLFRLKNCQNNLEPTTCSLPYKPKLFDTFVLCPTVQKNDVNCVEDDLQCFSLRPRLITPANCKTFFQIHYLTDLIVQGLSEIHIWSFSIISKTNGLGRPL